MGSSPCSAKFRRANFGFGISSADPLGISKRKMQIAHPQNAGVFLFCVLTYKSEAFDALHKIKMPAFGWHILRLL
jgi:hypothetical protein